MSKTVGGFVKLCNVFKVKRSMGDMFRTINLYDSSFLSEEEVCGICLVDFGDDKGMGRK
jgi:hypothetical protein